MSNKKDDNLLTALEVCVLVPCSYNALNYWYRFKKENPDNEYAKILPDFISSGERQTRYWRRSDIARIILFKTSVPQGCRGIMGEITQKYRKKEKKIEKDCHGRSKDWRKRRAESANS